MTTIHGNGTLPEGYYRVIYKPHPFRDEAMFCQFHQSANLQTVVDNLKIPHLDRSEIYINGTHVPRVAWSKVRPNSGVDVHVRLVPGDPGSIVAILSSVAGASATTFFTSIAGTFGTTLVGKLLISAAGAVVSGLVAQGLNSMFGLNDGPASYDDPINPDIRGARNTANWYGAVPVVLGTHRIAPLYGGVPYAETHKGKQFLRMLMVWGYGPVAVSDIKFGEQSIDLFENVDQEKDYDGSETELELYPSEADQQDFAIELEAADGYWTRTTAVQTTSLAITLSWPRGLFHLTGKGTRVARQVYLKGQYRKVGAATWVDWFEAAFPEIPKATGSALYRARRLTGLSKGTYEVRVKRTDQSGKELEDGRRNDGVVWTRLNSFGKGQPVNLTGIAKTAFRIKASDQLQGIVDQMNAIVSLKVPTWNGSAWTGTNKSSNPAAIYRWILTGPANASAVPTSRVDDDVLGDWYDYCETNEYIYNRIVSGRTSVKDILTEVAAAGYASPTITDNKWSVVIDRSKTTVVQHFTPRNSWGFSGSILYPEIPHALRVRFINEDAGYVEDERNVYDEGYDKSNATIYQTISVSGMTTPRSAWRMGRHFMATMRLRPEVFTFSTDVEGLIATRGDLIRFNHDVPKIGTHFGRVTSVSGNNVTFDERVTVLAGNTYTIRFRRNTGETNPFDYTATVDQETDTLTIPGLSNVWAGQMFQFGPENNDSVELLVQAIEPGDDLSMVLTCIPYQEGVYSSGPNIPPYETVITTPDTLALVGPRTPRIARIVSNESALRKTSTGEIIPAMIVYLASRPQLSSNNRTTTTAGFRVRWREQVSSTDPDELEDWTYEPNIVSDAGSLRIEGIEIGKTYDVQAQALGPGGEPSKWTQANAHTVVGTSSKPPALDTFRINSQGKQAYLEWEYDDIPLDVVRFVIRWHPDLDETSWQEMNALARAIPFHARSHTVPNRAGTYAIRAVDVAGNWSPALYVNASETDDFASELGENITIMSKTEDPSWTGTRSGTYIDVSELALDNSLFMAEWTTLSDVVAIGQGATQQDGEEMSGTYEFGETDLGAVYTSTVYANAVLGINSSLNVMAGWDNLTSVDTLAGEASNVDTDVEIQVARSVVDSGTPNYGGWRTFAIGDYTARHLKFRVVMKTTNGFVSPTVRTLNVSADLQSRKLHGEDISSGAGAKSVTFPRDFYQSPSIVITAQDMQTGDYYAITSKSAAGFTITFRNSGGSAVSRTFDWTAIGYGRKTP